MHHHHRQPHKSLGSISRAADGRFILADSSVYRSDSYSNISSSDDGGFLPRRSNYAQDHHNRASWRKPLIGYPSQLSLRSDASGQSARANYLAQQMHYPIPTVYSISHYPYLHQSSPAASSALMFSPMYFNDLSSVHYANDRSYPTPPGFVQLKSVHERYSQELPSLRAIHEESQGFIPVHPIRDSPHIRVPPPYPAIMPVAATRSRAKLLPRHARVARSAPELDYLDRSPESRSSSSGFGSKNTSSQQNQSSQSGSTFLEWKLPPYRHPPPAPSANEAPGTTSLPPPPPAQLGTHWLLEIGSSSSPSMSLKAVDVGSVDGHYEFDPATPTPTPSTPTRGGGDFLDLDAASSYRKGYTTKYTRYDNIDARVRAMKEEFNEFRKRQAKRRRTGELESIC